MSRTKGQNLTPWTWEAVAVAVAAGAAEGEY